MSIKTKKPLDANELADLIVEKRLKTKQRSYDIFKQKCMSSISVMAVEERDSTTIDMSEEDVMALGPVTEELRKLGYKFKFIERVMLNSDKEEESVEHQLVISLRHLLGDLNG